MPSLLQSQAGPALAGNNTPLALRSGTYGDLITSELHGRYYEATKQGTMFNGGIVGQVTTVGLTTTYTGLCLSNSIGSVKNLVLNKVGFAFTVAFPAGAFVGLMTGYSPSVAVTHTTPVTPRSQLFGTGVAGVGLLDSSATLSVAPTINTIFGAGLTGAITTTPMGLAGVVDMEGSIILPPGAFVAIYTSTVSGAAGGAFSFQWEEVSNQY